MSFIRKIFGRKAKKISLTKLAKIPLELMKSKTHPFDDWQDPEVDVPEDMRQLFNFYAWLYQLYMFYMIASETLGNGLAVKIIEDLSESEKQILGSNLFNIYENINNIHAAIQQLLENPVIEDIEGELNEMPLEYGLAKQFLFTRDFSPMKFKEKDIDLGEVAILGLCLSHAKQPAISYWENILGSVEIGENA